MSGTDDWAEPASGAMGTKVTKVWRGEQVELRVGLTEPVFGSWLLSRRFRSFGETRHDALRLLGGRD